MVSSWNAKGAGEGGGMTELVSVWKVGVEFEEGVVVGG